MTPEAINITIAEHLGWKLRGNLEFDNLIKEMGIHINNALALPPGAKREPGQWALGPFVSKTRIPNYCGDLNAMHEAKNHLGGEERIDFIDALCRIVKRDDDGPYTAMTKAFYAEADQEAEAFLHTVGKWKEAV